MRPLRRYVRLLDVLIAAALFVWLEIDVALADDVGSQPAAAVAAFFLTAPVIFRREAPLLALAFVAAAWAAQAAAGASLTQAGAAPVALLILVYSTATRRSGVMAAVAVPIGVGGFWAAIFIESAQDLGDHVPNDYVATLLFVTAVWFAGYAMRRHAIRIVGLETETSRLARERDERARAAVAAERGRIARDLHDVVAHNVSVMVVQAAAAEEVLARDPERARAPLLAIQETGNQALTEMRRLLGILRAEIAESGRQPGLAGIDALAAEFREAGLPVELSVEGDRTRLPSGVDLAAYRIVEEALTNALKHAGGAATRVSVRHVDGAVELEVTDEGPGSSGDSGGGHGLIGMRERAGLYGGTFTAGPSNGGGFSVRARLPLASDVVIARAGQ